LLRSTNWYMNYVDSMHLSGNIACQSWPILRIFFSTRYNPMRGEKRAKLIPVI
jgi:hypothetical protein